jgi:hypothetical protein
MLQALIDSALLLARLRFGAKQLDLEQVIPSTWVSTSDHVKEMETKVTCLQDRT